MTVLRKRVLPLVVDYQSKMGWATLPHPTAHTLGNPPTSLILNKLLELDFPSATVLSKLALRYT